MNKPNFDMKTTMYTYEISTVSLPEGYAESRLGAYETMIRSYKNDWLDYQERYNTEEEAISGHIQAIAYVDQLHQEESVKV